MRISRALLFTGIGATTLAAGIGLAAGTRLIARRSREARRNGVLRWMIGVPLVVGGSVALAAAGRAGWRLFSEKRAQAKDAADADAAPAGERQFDEDRPLDEDDPLRDTIQMGGSAVGGADLDDAELDDMDIDRPPASNQLTNAGEPTSRRGKGGRSARRQQQHEHQAQHETNATATTTGADTPHRDSADNHGGSTKRGASQEGLGDQGPRPEVTH